MCPTRFCSFELLLLFFNIRLSLFLSHPTLVNMCLKCVPRITSIGKPLLTGVWKSYIKKTKVQGYIFNLHSWNWKFKSTDVIKPHKHYNTLRVKQFIFVRSFHNWLLKLWREDVFRTSHHPLCKLCKPRSLHVQNVSIQQGHKQTSTYFNGWISNSFKYNNFTLEIWIAYSYEMDWNIIAMKCA